MPEATVNVPEGMSPEEFMKAFATFQKAKVTAQAKDKAVRGALKTLIANHKAEYDSLVNAGMKAPAKTPAKK